MLGTYHRLNLTIYASPREVIRAARRKLNSLILRDPIWRTERHLFYRRMLSYHAAARNLAKEFRL